MFRLIVIIIVMMPFIRNGLASDMVLLTEGKPMPICSLKKKRVNCVVDGDTFWLDRVKYRFYRIDTPERGRREKCKDERILADKATVALSEILSNKPIFVVLFGNDRYYRKLANVIVEGKDVGDQLKKMGLAKTFGKDVRGKFKWCIS